MGNTDSAVAILEAVGGANNVEHLTNCATRLRFTLKDASNIDKSQVESIPGVLAAIPQSDTSYQIVIGPTVEDMRKEVEKIMEDGSAGNSSSNKKEKVNNKDKTIEDIKSEHRSKIKNKKVVDTLFEYLSDSFRPIIGILLAASMVIAVVNIFIAFKVIPNDTSNSTVLFFKAISQSVFYFIAIFVAYNACKKLKVDPWLGVVVMLVFITPQFLALSSPEMYESVFASLSDIDAIKEAKNVTEPLLQQMGISDITHIFGLPMLLHDYSGNVFVPLLMCPILAILYNFIKKIVPSNLQLIIVPALVIVIMSLVTGFVIGPLGIYLGSTIGDGLSWLNYNAPLVLVFVIPLIYPFLVPLGLHWPLNALMIANINTLGYDFIQGPMGIYDFACYGASFGVLLIAIRENNKGMKAIAGGAVAAGLLGGISEPSLYGIHLRYKKAYPIMISGCVAGALVIGLLGMAFPSSIGVPGVITKAFAFTSVLTIPVFDQIWVYFVSIAVAFATPAILVNIFDYRTTEQKAEMRALSTAENLGLVDVVDLMHMPSDQRAEFVEEKGGNSKSAILNEEVFSPIAGTTQNITKSKDKMFNKKVLGDGIVIMPVQMNDTSTEIKSPVSGTITSVAKSKHAYTIKTDDGIGILIHIGSDTVNLNGKHFESSVQNGDSVSTGDVLGTANFKKIQDAGYDIPVFVCVVNSRFLDSVNPIEENIEVKEKDKVINIKFKS